MDRRDFLKAVGAAGAFSALPLPHAAHAQGKRSDLLETKSREALRELLELLREVDERYLGPEWHIERAGDVSDGHRFLMHVLQGALFSEFEADPERPVFRRIVSPTRKFLGDNPDAIYFAAPIRAGRGYRLRSNRAGAVYASITVEGGAAEGRYASRVAAAMNDTQFEVAADGGFELILGGEPRAKNWLELPHDAARLTTRHYFEEAQSVAADPLKSVPIEIEPLHATPPPPTWDDASIAAGIQRVINDVRGKTLEQPPPDPSKLPAWVSLVPNHFEKPERPGDLAFAAVDNAYTMAPYALGPEEALVIEGRFPRCRFANVVLWNRFLQSYDYAHRRISLNRVQTVLEDDGSFRMVVAHRDPGVSNWLDTEGRPSGSIYWRFLLPEEDPTTPQARVVPYAEVAKA